jgi:hypothetical protein
MTALELTKPAPAATTATMQGKRTALGFGVVMALALGGCVSVNAPDKPIVIELNINIKQEVIYRLSQDAGNTIDKNPEIF